VRRSPSERSCAWERQPGPEPHRAVPYGAAKAGTSDADNTMPTPATQAGSNQAAGDHFASVTHALGRLIARLGSAHRETDEEHADLETVINYMLHGNTTNADASSRLTPPRHGHQMFPKMSPGRFSSARASSRGVRCLLDASML
jgi:hypothetical protein